MRYIIKNQTCDVVIMHHQGIPVSKQLNHLPPALNPIELIAEWGKYRIDELTHYGIAPERLILDVGIGFGKTAEQSLELLKTITAFKKLNLRLLVGHSRKSFLNLFTSKPFPERDVETLVVSLHLARQAIDYLRIHNVLIHAEAFKVAQALS